MLFQNIELYETDKFQYLLIHKNGSSSVQECIKHLNPILTNKINFNKIRWTVIREPLNRFISGLKYDLKQNNLKLNDIHPDSLNNFRINSSTKEKGYINHCTSQVTYLMNVHIDWYIELKDLSTFLKMHFNKTEHLNSNQENNKSEDLPIIDKNEILTHLNLDYYVYKQILNSSYLWKWQNGKIF